MSSLTLRSAGFPNAHNGGTVSALCGAISDVDRNGGIHFHESMNHPEDTRWADARPQNNRFSLVPSDLSIQCYSINAQPI
ncbi:MAG: hypothetical protein AAGJ83_07210 [Planctomycetota bacterium]